MAVPAPGSRRCTRLAGRSRCRAGGTPAAAGPSGRAAPCRRPARRRGRRGTRTSAPSSSVTCTGTGRSLDSGSTAHRSGKPFQRGSEEPAVLRHGSDEGDARAGRQRLRRAGDAEVRPDPHAVEVDAFHGRARRPSARASRTRRTGPARRRPAASAFAAPVATAGSTVHRRDPPVLLARRIQASALEEKVAAVGDQIGPMLPGTSGTPKSGWNGRGSPPSAETRNIGNSPLVLQADVLHEDDLRAVGREAGEAAAVDEPPRLAAERRHDEEAARSRLRAIHHARPVRRDGRLVVVGGVVRQSRRRPAR